MDLEPTEVVTERVFPVEPARLWEAVSEPEQLGRWLGGDVEFEPRPGTEGTVRFGEDEGGEHVLYVEEVDPERRLVLRWASASEVPTQVGFELLPESGGTRLVVTERVVPPGLAVAQMRASALAGTR